jgi:hypothetical protein
VELEQMINRHHGDEPGKFSFADSPLIDCVTYISRSYDCPIIIDCIGLEEAGILIDEPVTRDFEVTTLADGLDKLLTPLKLTWIYQDEVFKVVTQASDAARPTLFVHQLDDGLLAPKHPLEKEDWLNQLRSICSFAMGTRKLRFEVWFNRLIVYEPWRSQYRLSRNLDEMLYHPNRKRRLNGSVRKSD